MYTKHIRVEELKIGHRIITGWGGVYEVRGIVAPYGLGHFRSPVKVHVQYVAGDRLDGKEADTCIWETERDLGNFCIETDDKGTPVRELGGCI